eukprot:Gb_10559 [translate_table: standard]
MPQTKRDPTNVEKEEVIKDAEYGNLTQFVVAINHPCKAQLATNTIFSVFPGSKMVVRSLHYGYRSGKSDVGPAASCDFASLGVVNTFYLLGPAFSSVWYKDWSLDVETRTGLPLLPLQFTELEYCGKISSFSDLARDALFQVDMVFKKRRDQSHVTMKQIHSRMKISLYGFIKIKKFRKLWRVSLGEEDVPQTERDPASVEEEEFMKEANYSNLT